MSHPNAVLTPRRALLGMCTVVNSYKLPSSDWRNAYFAVIGIFLAIADPVIAHNGADDSRVICGLWV